MPTTNPVTILAFDLETTSSQAHKASIVQFASLTVPENDLLKVRPPTENILINPGTKIPPGATEIHGITDDDVADKETFDHHAAHIQQLVDQADKLLAYNARYDVQILDRHLTDAGQPGIPPTKPIIDPLELEKHINPRSLEAVYHRRTGNTLDDAHDALADTHAALHVYHHQLGTDEPEHTHLADLLEHTLGTRPADIYGKLGHDEDGDLIFLFGKNTGKKVRDCPDYVDWMKKKSFPPQVMDLIDKAVLGETPDPESPMPQTS